MSFTVLSESANRLDISPDTFTVQTETLTKHQWHEILQRFDDASLMQTWSYGAARWGQHNLSHILLRQNGEVVGAAQAVIKKVPLLAAGLAHIKRGPLWQLRGRQRNPEILRQMLRELRSVYEVRRGLFLRIAPNSIEDYAAIRAIFDEEGFDRDLSNGAPRTAFIDLSYPLEQLRSSLKPTWRRNLILGERNRLTIKHGASDELFEIFAKLYLEMLDRKAITGIVNIAHFKEMQRTLPDALKIRVMICDYEGEPVAGIAVPYLGNTAQNLLAATGDKGLRLRGSYLLQWRMLEWLKVHGCRWYDLDAVNHDAYPGISQFKMGLAGRLGFEAEYAGQFESCTNSFSHISVKVGDQLLRNVGKIDVVIMRWKQSRLRHAAR